MSRVFTGKFAQQIEDMIRFRETLGYSRISYEHYLYHFDKFTRERYPEESVITREMIIEWASLRPNEKKAELIRRIITFRHLAKYLSSNGIPTYIPPVPSNNGCSQCVPYIFSDYELAAFFKAADSYDDNKRSPYRQYIVPVIFRLIYCCGLRPNEGRDLEYRDIDLSSGEIIIRKTKRHRERRIVISDDVLELCRKYDRIIQGQVGRERKYFFPKKNGEAYTGTWLCNEFKRCWEYAGIIFQGYNNNSPRVYDFRHNFATRTMMDWLESGKDLYSLLPYLSTYMGHETFSQTAYYIHLLPERLTKSSAIDWKRFERMIPDAPEVEL